MYGLTPWPRTDPLALGPKTKLRELRRRGLPDALARPLAATRKGPWHTSANGYLARALPTQYFTRTLGLVLLG